MRPQLTIEAFADWCEKQPRRNRYNVYNPITCAVGKYAQSLGFYGSDAGFEILTTRHGPAVPIDGLTDDAVGDKPHTFSALAKRLRAQPA